jgi:hypothetical protein
LADQGFLLAAGEAFDLFFSFRGLIGDEIVFDYIFEADRRRMGRIKPIRTYRNPIFLALEWAEAMEAGNLDHNSVIYLRLDKSCGFIDFK